MKRIVCLYFTLILLSPAPLFSAFHPARTSAPDMQTAIKNIDQNQLSLEESMADLSNIFGVKIELIEKSNNYTNKFNLNLKQATLGHALKEAIRKAGIQSHALIWNQNNKTLRILTFESGKNGSNIDTKKNLNGLFQDDMNPLTPEQLYLLAEQDTSLASDEGKPLTPAELQHLQKQNKKIEAKEQKKRNPLTLEQLQQLQKHSEEIESKEQESMKPLTADQMRILEKQASENTSQQPKIDPLPLTREQMLLLQESE